MSGQTVTVRAGGELAARRAMRAAGYNRITTAPARVLEVTAAGPRFVKGYTVTGERVTR